MARIRSVHPGLFTDESFMELTVEEPLAIPVLLGLLCDADDHGVFAWKPLTLKSRILPAATTDIRPLLDVLVGKRFIKKFTVGSADFGVVRNFTKWQRPKSPKYVHPITPEMRAWAGISPDEPGNWENDAPINPDEWSRGDEMNGDDFPNDDTSSPPNGEMARDHVTSFPGKGEIPPQREEGGGKRKEGKKETRDARVVGLDFERWYSGYPHKVGRADAEKAFAAATKDTSPDVLIAGLRRYIATKPPDRPWCNPGTWLRQRRWLDEPALPLGAGGAPRRAVTPMGPAGG